MPVKVSTTLKASFAGKFVSLPLIKELVKNFIDFTSKKDIDTGNVRPMDQETDAYSIWFSKAEIDQLILDNSSGVIKSDGIRIYMGLHGISAREAEELPNRPAGYKNQHTAILVSTFNDSGINRDILNDGSFVTLGGAEGMGLDEGSIAPPPYPIEGSAVTPL